MAHQAVLGRWASSSASSSAPSFASRHAPALRVQSHLTTRRAFQILLATSFDVIQLEETAQVPHA
jgi:hypothetical protein